MSVELNEKVLRTVVTFIHLGLICLLALFVTNVSLFAMIKIGGALPTWQTVYTHLGLEWLGITRIIAHLVCFTCCLIIGSRISMFGLKRKQKASQLIIVAIGIQILLIGALNLSWAAIIMSGGWWHLITTGIIVCEAFSIVLTSIITFMYWKDLVAFAVTVDEAVQKNNRVQALR